MKLPDAGTSGLSITQNSTKSRLISLTSRVSESPKFGCRRVFKIRQGYVRRRQLKLLIWAQGGGAGSRRLDRWFSLRSTWAMSTASLTSLLIQPISTKSKAFVVSAGSLMRFLKVSRTASKSNFTPTKAFTFMSSHLIACALQFRIIEKKSQLCQDSSAIWQSPQTLEPHDRNDMLGNSQLTSNLRREASTVPFERGSGSGKVSTPNYLLWLGFERLETSVKFLLHTLRSYLRESQLFLVCDSVLESENRALSSGTVVFDVS